MDTFSTEYSTLSTKALLAFAKKHYSLEDDFEISFLKRGFNDTYTLFNKSQTFILRVYNNGWRSEKSIANELNLLNFLATNHISVSTPIKDINGNYFNPINASEGKRFIALFTYAKGIQSKKLSIEQSGLLGAELAKIHLLTQNLSYQSVSVDYDINKQFEDIISTLTPILSNYPEKLNFLIKLQSQFLKTFESINSSELSKGICHGDIQSENFYFDNEKITFFDFDFFGNGYLIYDIGVFIWYDHKNKKPEIIRAFLDGYQSIKKLSESEIKMIPYMSTLRALFQMTLFCKLNNGIRLPLWPHNQAAEFIQKVENWHSEIINKNII